MAVNFRRFSRRHGRLGRNRVASVDNLLEEREPRKTGRDRTQSADRLDFSGVDNSNALPRKIAWADTCNNSNKLTEDWMKDWQVITLS